jgi:putative flippase GtrA
MKFIFDIIFIKFILVGLANTAFGSLIMFLLYNIGGFTYWQSSAANYFFGSILSFFLNKYFTFKIKNWSLKICVFFILNIVVCYFIAYGLAKHIFSFFFKNTKLKLQENIAMLFGMCVFTFLNYCGQRFFVFKKK